MTEAPEVEVIEPKPEFEPRVRVTHLRAIGVVGTVLALLTMLAAVSVGLLAFFGTTLLAAAGVKLVWPWVFSPQFTLWVFGSERVPFWKLFVLFAAARAVTNLFRRRLSWQRK